MRRSGWGEGAGGTPEDLPKGFWAGVADALEQPGWAARLLSGRLEVMYVRLLKVNPKKSKPATRRRAKGQQFQCVRPWEEPWEQGGEGGVAETEQSASVRIIRKRISSTG